MLIETYSFQFHSSGIISSRLVSSSSASSLASAFASAGSHAGIFFLYHLGADEKLESMSRTSEGADYGVFV